MNDLLKKFPRLMVGSYPVMNNPVYKVKVTLESKQEDYLLEALQYFTSALPQGAIVNVE